MIEISIVITTINRPMAVGALLRSILQQDYTGQFQVVLIDQNSANDTERIVHDILNDRLCENRSIIKTYVRNTALTGLTQARNLGISLSRGSIIIFFDDDCIIESNYLTSTAEIFSRAGDMVAAVGTTLYDTRKNMGALLHNLFYHGYYGKHCSTMPKGRYTVPVEVYFISGLSMAFRKKIIEQYPFDEALTGYSFGEDMEISLRLRKMGYRILFNPHTIVTHYSLANRYRQVNYFSAQVYNNFYLFNKNVPKTMRNTISFGLVIASVLVRIILIAGATFSFNPIRGGVRGIVRVIRAYAKNDFRQGFLHISSGAEN